MNFAEELRGSLQEFLVGATIEIRENGGRITAISALSWEMRGEGGKPLFHLWAQNCNVTRRVLAIADQSRRQLDVWPAVAATRSPDLWLRHCLRFA